VSVDAGNVSLIVEPAPKPRSPTQGNDCRTIGSEARP
jgi:hypothetical protein